MRSRLIRARKTVAESSAPPKNSRSFFSAWQRASAPFALCLLAIAAGTAPAQFVRPNITKGVRFDQRLNAPVPLDLVFHDEANEAVPLRTYFGDKPVVLALVYYKCPNLCNLTLTEMASSLKRVALQPGNDYNAVVVSIDPAETPTLAEEKKSNYAKVFNRSGFDSGWHFLTGSQDSISRLAAAVGFHYRWDEPTHQFVHAAGIMIVTPDGKLSRYVYGVQYAPADLRLGLVEASQHKIGTPVDYALLYCFHYDASQGKYTLAIMNVLKLAGGVTIICLAALVFFLMRREKGAKTEMPWKEAQHVR
ncbi:MAG TPA: SCO family protein [Bryobacteraceae bacterium]|jgi:protein SCO1/2|nr:SCO family protein [Bryobacteraceae bacterium]